MNIMIFNVPAETVGALSVLNDFYNEVKSHPDKSINWIIVLSKPNLEETDNIKVLRFPWVKRSWLHRLYFDNIVASKLIKKFKVDKVLSLQNVIIPHTNVSQVLYMHNSLPFAEYKFTFKENRHLWIYQNIIGKKILSSIKKADKVIVQSAWIKEACIKKAKIPSEKISVIPPRINAKINKFFVPDKESFTTFFYPASEFEYKNHKLIIEACKKLKQKNIKDYRVLFTLKGDENNYVSRLYAAVKENKLPIKFIGSLSREKVFILYTKSVLLFPSYIETYGLPMLEAKLHKGIILASDCSFSHEILDGYENAYFFNPFDADLLAKLIEKININELKYLETQNNYKLSKDANSLLSTLIE